jgi:hypothetical protein
MNDQEKENYERNVKEANDVKAVVNSKGWKETMQPRIIMARDQIIMNGKRGESSEIFIDDSGKQRTIIKVNPSDPYGAARALWMVEGIDAIIQLFEEIISVGEVAKSMLKKSDTITKL